MALTWSMPMGQNAAAGRLVNRFPAHGDVGAGVAGRPRSRQTPPKAISTGGFGSTLKAVTVRSFWLLRTSVELVALARAAVAEVADDLVRRELLLRELDQELDRHVPHFLGGRVQPDVEQAGHAVLGGHRQPLGVHGLVGLDHDEGEADLAGVVACAGARHVTSRPVPENAPTSAVHS